MGEMEIWWLRPDDCQTLLGIAPFLLRHLAILTSSSHAKSSHAHASGASGAGVCLPLKPGVCGNAIALFLTPHGTATGSY